MASLESDAVREVKSPTIISNEASSDNGTRESFESNKDIQELKNGRGNSLDASKDDIGGNLNVKLGAASENNAVRKRSLLLRPSALVRDSNSSLILKPPSLTAGNGTFKKFAHPDESDSSVPNKSEKADFAMPSKTVAPIIPSVVSLSNPNYVFGQNIKDRIVEDNGCTATTSNGLLFTSAVIADTKNDNKSGDKESSSLLEDAARCQEQRNSKRKYEEVQVTTGEEDENNILQMVVKLFAFEGGCWVERGRGTLRLNDSGGGGDGGSRIVIRTLGSLRVILNTKIWSGMELSKASEKSVRTTAVDATGILRIYLIQASPSDVNTLYDSMDVRIKKTRTQELHEKNDGKRNIGEHMDPEMKAPSPKVPALDS